MTHTQRVRLGPGGEFTANARGVRGALDRGHRWLVLTAPELRLDSPIDLSDVDLRRNPSQFLRIDGGPGARPVVRRAFSIAAPLIGAFGARASRTWHLYFTNVIFEGSPRDSAPLCEFRNVDRSYFRGVVWRGGGGHGLILGHEGEPIPDSGGDIEGTYQASTTRLFDCAFHDLGGAGLMLRNAIDIGVIGGGARRTRVAIDWLGPRWCVSPRLVADARLRRKLARGIGSILDFSVAETRGPHSIVIDRAYMVRLRGVQSDRPVRLGPSALHAFADDA